MGLHLQLPPKQHRLLFFRHVFGRFGGGFGCIFGRCFGRCLGHALELVFGLCEVFTWFLGWFLEVETTYKTTIPKPTTIPVNWYEKRSCLKGLDVNISRIHRFQHVKQKQQQSVHGVSQTYRDPQIGRYTLSFRTNIFRISANKIKTKNKAMHNHKSKQQAFKHNNHTNRSFKTNQQNKSNTNKHKSFKHT